MSAWDDPEVWAQKLTEAQDEIARLRERESEMRKTFAEQILTAEARVARLEDALREIADPENDTSEARRIARRALGEE